MNPEEETGEHEAEKYAKLFVFSGGNKAGMEAMDKERQARVIYEMSKNSAFFKRATKLDEAANQKALAMEKDFLAVDEQANPALHRRLVQAMERRCLEAERRRSFAQICCVLDMDMFYAAVEIRDQPQLRELPVAVGDKNMISTSNYVARKFGVRSAMPGFIAKKLCPQLVFVPCNFDKYRAVAEHIRAVIAEYDPLFHSLSLDEVYFDLTPAAFKRYQEQRKYSNSADISVSHDAQQQMSEEEQAEEEQEQSTWPPRTDSPSVPMQCLRPIACEILQEIRLRIKTVTNGLTCSAGVANNFLLAKICADVHKPDGQFELAADRQSVLDFLETLPTRKVGGIGKVTEKILDKLGMKTMGDLRRNLHRALHTFSPASSDFLLHASLGIGREEGRERLQSHSSASSSSSSSSAVSRKSIGCERTYSAKGISQPNELFAKLHEICVQLGESMAKEQFVGQTLTLKVKDTDFNLHTRCQSSASCNVQSAQSIERIAQSILSSLLPIKVRLLGVSVSKLRSSVSVPVAHTNSPKSVLDFFHNMPQHSPSVNRSKQSDEPYVIDIDEASNDESRWTDAADEEHREGEDILCVCEDDSHQLEPNRVSATHHDDENDNEVVCLEVEDAIDADKEREHIQKESKTEAISSCCPICSQPLPMGLFSINQHIDRCLGNSPSSFTPQSSRKRKADHPKATNHRTQKNISKNNLTITSFFKSQS